MRSKKKSQRKPRSKTISLYACGVDWDHEIGEASDLEGRQPLYSSVDRLKKERKCTHQCGIVKLSLTLDEWVEPQDFSKPNNPDGSDE